MTRAEQKEAARQFYYKWNNKGQEDEDDQSFWLDILQQIFGITNATDRIQFQKKVVGEDGNIKRIDAYIPETKVLIEQKNRTVNLDNPQPGHAGQTPYMQAKRYNDNLPYDEKAKWIVVSNFKTIRIYDMNQRKPKESMQVIYLDNLQTDYVKLEFLFKKEVKEIYKEMQISKEAGDIIGEIYDALLKRYKNPESKESLRSLNALCVRLVFCMYAEDAGLFGENNLFSKYMRDIISSFISSSKIKSFDEFLLDESVKI